MGKKNVSKIELDSSFEVGKKPLRSHPRTLKGKKSSSPTVIDLTESEREIIEIDIEPKSAIAPEIVPVLIDLGDEPEDMVIDLVSKENKQELLLQYKQQLSMHDKEISGTIMRQLKKNVFALQTKAFEKYSDDTEKQSLEALVSMVDHFDEKQAHNLLNNEWLNDETINQYLHILSKQHDHIAAVISNFATNPKDFFEKLKNNHRSLNQTRSKLINAQRLLWPICDDNHWYLVIIDKISDEKFNIFCLDSFNSEKAEYLEKAKLLLQSLYPDQSIDDLVNKEGFINIPEQNNGVDCGVAVSYYAKLCTNKTLPRSKKGQCDYSQFRVDIAETLCKNVDVEVVEQHNFTKKPHPKMKCK